MPHILILGQAPALKSAAIPFERTRLYKWFETVGISKETLLDKCLFDALLDFYPGRVNNSDRVPTNQEIQENIPRLLNIIKKNKIKLIIPVGKIAIQAVLNNPESELSKTVGKIFERAPFNLSNPLVKVIPLPHPSGLSTWQYNQENKLLLQQAMNLIKEIFETNP